MAAIKLLMDRGADPNMGDDEKLTPLHRYPILLFVLCRSCVCVCVCVCVVCVCVCT